MDGGARQRRIARERSAGKRGEEAEYTELDEEFETQMAGTSRRGVHTMWRTCGGGGNVSELYKGGSVDRAAGWAVGNTLTMTVAFSLLMTGPNWRPEVPFSFWTMHLFQCFAMLSTVVSVRGIAEIACVQEDLAVLPPALMSEWQASLSTISKPVDGIKPVNNLGAGRDGGGPYEFTYISLKLLMSSAVFMLYTLNGPACLVWLVPVYLLHAKLDTWSANHRCRGLAWRTLEAKVWAKEEMRARYPDEFRAWAKGEGYFFLGFVGFPHKDKWPYAPGQMNLCGQTFALLDWALTLEPHRKLFCVKELGIIYDYIIKSYHLLNSEAVAEIERVRQLSVPAGSVDPVKGELDV